MGGLDKGGDSGDKEKWSHDILRVGMTDLQVDYVRAYTAEGEMKDYFLFSVRLTEKVISSRWGN